jgi:magnesium transporter
MKALVLDGDVVTVVHDYPSLAEAHRQGKMFWVELDERTDEAEAFLERDLCIHPLAIEDVWNDLGLPKVEDYGEYVQIVVHAVREADRALSEVPLALSELDLLIGHNFLVTHARDEKLCAVTPVQSEIQRNGRLLKKGPAWVAHAVMDRMVDEYLPLIDRFDEQIESIEEKILDDEARHAKGDRDLIPRILRIKRALQLLRRTTIYQREILLRLARAEFDEIPRDLVPFYRDVYDHFARVTELVDSYRELVTSLLEAHLSMQSNRLNEVMKRLTIMSTIMLPLSVIAGIYGMNFEHMPELKWVWGYPFALALMSIVALAILGWFRAKKWF